MAKVKNDYFKLAEEQVSYSVQAAELLEKILSDYSVESIPGQKERMHEIENKADELHHQIHALLAAEFITPIDQEDILHLVQIVDDITDSIDEVVLNIFMYDLDGIPEYAPAMAKLVHKCVNALYEAVKELKNFKKPENLHKLLITVNSIESQADATHAEAIHNLFKNFSDAKKLIGDKAVYASLENCCDLCEHASDVIEQIIIKNT